MVVMLLGAEALGIKVPVGLGGVAEMLGSCTVACAKQSVPAMSRGKIATTVKLRVLIIFICFDFTAFVQIRDFLG
jgi:hypothetical protein